jgi:HK97 family phage portal protein
MRLFRRREPVLPVATNALPPQATLAEVVAQVQGSTNGSWAGGGSVGTVDRCLQLNSQQVAAMPLRYKHAEGADAYEPAWTADPDPAWYPNGITDAVFALVWSIYAHGDAFLYVTSRYMTGYPRTWTILDPVTMKVTSEDGGRVYESNHVLLDPGDVIQVSRNPTGALRGTSALDAYWANVQSAYQAEAYAADVYASTGVNRVALRSARRLEANQAADLQAQWVEAVSRRLGAPAILPPDLELLQTLSISPKDLMLLESREWDARQIAAAFGVPAILLNIAVSGGLTYQNPVQLFELWWRSELMPTAGKVQGALSRWLPRGHWVEFDPSVSIRPDFEKMVAVFSKAYADGVITADEYRAAVFDLPPIERGDQGAGLYEEAGAHGPIQPVSVPLEVVQ